MAKKWMTGLVALSLALSVSASAFAQDGGMITTYVEDVGELPTFADGRINAFDLAAPVVVYYTHETHLNEDGEYYDAVDGIELWAVGEDSTSQVVYASLDEIEDLIAGTVESINGAGYSLTYNDGWFSVSAPADHEGKTYNFSWENLSITTG
jgi:hypothetical protein